MHVALDRNTFIGRFALRLATLKRYSYMVNNLVKKDFTLKYRRSILGVLWSVLNPLLMMIITSAVFSNIFRMQMKNYAVYYFTGSLIFNYMSEATNGSLYSILWASGLIKKVYIPKYIFPLEKCLFGLVNCFFSLIVVLILMPILGVPLNVYDFLVFIPILYTLVFSYGLGLILAAVEVFFRDIGHLYSVWITAWLYLTPILYPVDMLPKNISSWIYYNPMYYYIKYFRQLTMDAQLPTLTDNLQCAAIAVSFLIVGLLVFKKMQDRFILYI